MAVYSAEDELSLHVQSADEAYPLQKRGAAGYLDDEDLLRIAQASSCDCVHPGYGFLSESADFARKCVAKGLTFIGPSVAALKVFGDKVASREVATRCSVPVVPGTRAVQDESAARQAMKDAGISYPVLLKASAGGGGKGMRVVKEAKELAEAFDACSREALAAFGHGEVFTEKYIHRPRHIEVQIVADEHGGICHLFERDCSVQQRHQKLIEIAPAQGLRESVKQALYNAAIILMREVGYVGVGTVEFLVDSDERFYFIECNPRLQVEHTITEEVTGVDIVEAQFRIAANERLASIGIVQAGLTPRGCAIQCRVQALSPGTLSAYKEPSGPGIRVDSYGYLGFTPSLYFDPLLAKVICKARSFNAAMNASTFALEQFHLDGVDSNLSLLLSLLASKAFQDGIPTTSVFEEAAKEASFDTRSRVQTSSKTLSLLTRMLPKGGGLQPTRSERPQVEVDVPEGHALITSPLQGQVIKLLVGEGDTVVPGMTCALVLSMKMEHQIDAEIQGTVVRTEIQQDQFVEEGDPVFLIELNEHAGDLASIVSNEVDVSHIRADLSEVLERRRITTDAARMEHDPNFSKRVARRHQSHMRTARENVLDICNDGTFVEYGRFRVAAQRSRRSLDDLIHNTPADGIITGVGCINAEQFSR